MLNSYPNGDNLALTQQPSHKDSVDILELQPQLCRKKKIQRTKRPIEEMGSNVDEGAPQPQQESPKVQLMLPPTKEEIRLRIKEIMIDIIRKRADKSREELETDFLVRATGFLNFVPFLEKERALKNWFKRFKSKLPPKEKIGPSIQLVLNLPMAICSLQSPYFSKVSTYSGKKPDQLARAKRALKEIEIQCTFLKRPLKDIEDALEHFKGMKELATYSRDAQGLNFLKRGEHGESQAWKRRHQIVLKQKAKLKRDREMSEEKDHQMQEAKPFFERKMKALLKECAALHKEIANRKRRSFPPVPL